MKDKKSFTMGEADAYKAGFLDGLASAAAALAQIGNVFVDRNDVGASDKHSPSPTYVVAPPPYSVVKLDAKDSTNG